MRSLTVTLPDDIGETVEAKVAAGEYASESDVVRDGLAALFAGDADVESWPRGEVVERCDRRTTSPTPAIRGEEIVDRIRRRFAAKQT